MDLKNSDKKTVIGSASVAFSVLGLILGFIFRRLLFNTFTIGSWLAMIAFLMSLGAVQDHGNNILARTAFWLGTIALFVTVFWGAGTM